MESSDGLYAAAASLGIDLQLFCSYSSELTDEIILSCVGYANKLTGSLYTKMPESETLAESFLTQFPSINPLTAHAILSSGGVLVEFLEWSHECRIQAIQKYRVPGESVALLSAICRYGEREDSKSGITECSSSISSAPDWENCHHKIESERKKQKCIRSPSKNDILGDCFLNFESLNQFTKFTDFSLNTSRVSKPAGDSWMSNGPEMLDEIKGSGLSMENKWNGQKQGLEMGTIKNASTLFNLNDSQLSKDSEMLYDIGKPGLSLNDKLSGERHRSDVATGNWHNKNNGEDLRKDCKGEVIDLNDSFSIGEDFSSIAKSLRFSPLVLELDEDPTAGKSKTARRLSFSKSSHPTFSTAGDANYSSDIWTSLNRKQSLREGVVEFQDTEFGKGEIPMKNQKQLLQNSMHRSLKDFYGPSFQEKGMHYSGTPLSNALNSVHLPKGSPWTIEFLNRVREKSKLRQQSLPCDRSGLCFENSDNVSKVIKRKSPSILEFYKYQGGSTSKKVSEQSKKVSEQKRQKRHFKPSTYKKGNGSTSLCPTWTPTDKKARQVCVN